MCGIRTISISENDWLDAINRSDIHIKEHNTPTSTVTRVMLGNFTLFRKWERKESGNIIYHKFMYRGNINVR